MPFSSPCVLVLWKSRYGGGAALPEVMESRRIWKEEPPEPGLDVKAARVWPVPAALAVGLSRGFASGMLLEVERLDDRQGVGRDADVESG